MPINFSISGVVDEAGYELQPLHKDDFAGGQLDTVISAEVLRARDDPAGQPMKIVAKSGVFHPVEIDEPLYHDFVRVQATDDDVLAFVNRYGLLFDPKKPMALDDFKGAQVRFTDLYLRFGWEVHRGDLRVNRATMYREIDDLLRRVNDFLGTLARVIPCAVKEDQTYKEAAGRRDGRAVTKHVYRAALDYQAGNLYSGMALRMIEDAFAEKSARQCANPDCRQTFHLGNMSLTGKPRRKFCSPSCMNHAKHLQRLKAGYFEDLAARKAEAAKGKKTKPAKTSRSDQSDPKPLAASVAKPKARMIADLGDVVDLDLDPHKRNVL